MEKIFIIGAGITGLALGRKLKEKKGSSGDIAILEAGSAPGGWVQTIDYEGFLFELGPRSCRPAGSGWHTLKLVEELGLQDQVIIGSPQAKKRFLYHDKALHPLPYSLFSFLKSPLMRGVIPALLTEWKKKPSHFDDETIFSFASRRFGNAVAERFFDPLTSGIYAGDVRSLSMKSCFPFLYELERKHGSVIKGALLSKRSKRQGSPFMTSVQKHSLFSFKEGMSTLIRALASELEQNIRYQCKVVSLQFDRNKILLRLDNGHVLTADKVFACIPAYALAAITRETVPELAASLDKIEAASIASVSLGYRQRVLPYEGFGNLVPNREKEDILGIVWDSSVFPEQNRSREETRLTVMLGGKVREDLLEKDDGALIDIALKGVETQLGIKARPDAIYLNRSNNAIPQYAVGHSALIRDIEKTARQLSENFVILGNSFYGVAVNDCIAQGHPL